MNILRRIERHLRRYNVPPTRFGREAVRDPRLVLDMRNGRQPGPQMVERISRFMDRMDVEAGR